MADEGRKEKEASDGFRQAYDRWSASYDDQPNRTRDLDAVVVRHLASGLAVGSVVEAGCGTGKNSRWLSARCRRLIALDFSAGMLEVAAAKVRQRNVQFIQCDLLQSWPLAAAKADLVLISLVLEHVPALEPVLSEAARVLRPGAQLIISEFHPDRIMSGAGARIRREDGGESVIGSFAHFPAAYRAAAMRAGLRVEAMAEWSDELLSTEPSVPIDARHPPRNPRLLSLILVKG